VPETAGFLVDVARLREQARREIDRGPVTDSYGADLDRVIDVLQEALATELVCTLRYRQHHHTARGMNAEPIAAEFLQHSIEELDHAERIAARIAQLGGAPDMDPSHLTGRAHSEYRTASSLREMVEENLVAERIAIASYTEVVAWLGTGDPTTRRMLEDILAVEEEHADDLVAMLDDSSAPD
jgi:bacterioferritin